MHVKVCEVYSSLPDDFSDVGGDEVTDELLSVVIDGPPFLYRCHYSREVVICQYHL